MTAVRVLPKPGQVAELRRLSALASEARARLELGVAMIALEAVETVAGREIHYELDVPEPFVEVKDPAPSEPSA